MGAGVLCVVSCGNLDSNLSICFPKITIWWFVWIFYQFDFSICQVVLIYRYHALVTTLSRFKSWQATVLASECPDRDSPGKRPSWQAASPGKRPVLAGDRPGKRPCTATVLASVRPGKRTLTQVQVLASDRPGKRVSRQRHPWASDRAQRQPWQTTSPGKRLS